MLECTMGVVLRLVRYGDDRLIAEVFTEKFGSLAFSVREKRGKRGSVQSMLLRPLNIVELELDYRQNVQLQRISELRMGYVYESLPYDAMKSTVALFLGEFLRQALHHEVENPTLFRFLTASLQWYDLAPDRYLNFHLAFLIRMTHELGFWPNLEECPDGTYFDLRDGILTDVPPLHGAFLNQEETARLPVLLRMTYDNMYRYRLTREHRSRIIDVLTQYYRLHVPEFAAIRSLDVLREVLG